MTAKTETKPMTGAGVSEQVLLLSVKDLSVDFGWNARSGKWWDDRVITTKEPDGTEKEENKPKKTKEKVTDHGDFGQFMASILETGTNQEPVLARHPSKPGGKPRLVCGFRRFKAIYDLAEQADFAGPTDAQRGLIRVIVRDMTDQQARIANAVENVARDDLSGPDLCWTVGQLVQEYNLTDSAVADRLGKSQPYISKLHRIHKDLSPKVLQMWRSSPVRVTIDDIEKQVIMITKDSDSRPKPDEQEDYFQRVIEGKGGKGASTRGPDGWIETKQNEASKLGVLLGTLQVAKIIDVIEEDPEVIVFTVVELPKRHKELNPAKQKKIQRSIVSAFASGVEAGMAASEEEEEGDEDEDEDEDEIE